MGVEKTAAASRGRDGREAASSRSVTRPIIVKSLTGAELVDGAASPKETEEYGDWLDAHLNKLLNTPQGQKAMRDLKKNATRDLNSARKELQGK